MDFVAPHVVARDLYDEKERKGRHHQKIGR